jgi:hypothetical protein
MLRGLGDGIFGTNWLMMTPMFPSFYSFVYLYYMLLSPVLLVPPSFEVA